jgi:SAM-dependent methyltransferase
MLTVECPAIDSRQARNVWYTLRRHFVDQFHFRRVPLLKKDSLVLDLGGDCLRKRGLFDIRAYPVKTVVVNFSAAKEPHVQADGSALPFAGETFDAVICSEVLEHVYDPKTVVAEIGRVLKKGGLLLACVPFSNKIHGDPFDYGRYTDFYWTKTMKALDFYDVQVEKQGLFWCVLMDMARDFVYLKTNRMRSPLWEWIAGRLMGLARVKALQWDASVGGADSALAGFTTGFGILAKKK